MLLFPDCVGVLKKEFVCVFVCVWEGGVFLSSNRHFLLSGSPSCSCSCSCSPLCFFLPSLSVSLYRITHSLAHEETASHVQSCHSKSLTFWHSHTLLHGLWLPPLYLCLEVRMLFVEDEFEVSILLLEQALLCVCCVLAFLVLLVLGLGVACPVLVDA